MQQRVSVLWWVGLESVALMMHQTVSVLWWIKIYNFDISKSNDWKKPSSWQNMILSHCTTTNYCTTAEWHISREYCTNWWRMATDCLMLNLLQQKIMKGQSWDLSDNLAALRPCCCCCNPVQWIWKYLGKRCCCIGLGTGSARRNTVRKQGQQP